MGRARWATPTIAATVLAVAIACALASAHPRNPFEVRLGVYLSPADSGVCAVHPPATIRRCTLAQADPRIEHLDGPGGRPKVPGHVVLYRLAPGKAGPHTTAVAVRFRALPGPRGPGGPVGPWQSLGLDGPKLQEFPVSVPFLPTDQIALDVVVRGDGQGEAAAPLADGGGDSSEGISEWTPPLAGSRRAPHFHSGAILAMNAVFERDDQTPPHLRYAYSRHQDFLRTGLVRVNFRSDTDARLQPECALLTHRVEWGLLYRYRHLRAGHWTPFVCEFDSSALRGARRAARLGGHPRVMIHPIAYDEAGNRGATPRIYVGVLRR